MTKRGKNSINLSQQAARTKCYFPKASSFTAAETVAGDIKFC